MSNVSSVVFVRRMINNGFTVIRSHGVPFRCSSTDPSAPSDKSTDESCKAANLAKKLRVKTPIGKLDELEEGRHPFQEKEPLTPWPNNTNPHTGEVGGPKGPEPTRYGDWERKGRVSDF